MPALLRYAAARGRDAGAIVERFALPAEAADRDEVSVIPSDVVDLLDATAELLADPFVALRLPHELAFRRYDLVELALRSSATLRDGLSIAARHGCEPLPQLEFALDETGDEACWYQRTPNHPRGIGRCAHEYGLAYVLSNARVGLAGALPVRRVWFAHARPRSLEPLERAFGCDELAFGAPDSGFAFAREVLDRPLHGDPRLLATVEAVSAARPPPPRSSALAPRIAAHLRDHLGDSAADVAAALHMSARTLQRRLADESTSFSGVLDATREAMARALLSDPDLPLAEIAYRVGFADLAAFSRAFKRWTGTPPGLFRRS